jgi:hypothetical protein
MGFRCPYCQHDFGLNKDAFQKHLQDNPKCCAEAWIYTDFVMDYVDGKRHGSRKYKCKEPKTSRHYDHVSSNHQWRKINLVTNDDGSDTVVCKRCGLKAKRFGSTLKFDMRYTRKIENCID